MSKCHSGQFSLTADFGIQPALAILGLPKTGTIYSTRLQKEEGLFGGSEAKQEPKAGESSAGTPSDYGEVRFFACLPHSVTSTTIRLLVGGGASTRSPTGQLWLLVAGECGSLFGWSPSCSSHGGTNQQASGRTRPGGYLASCPLCMNNDKPPHHCHSSLLLSAGYGPTALVTLKHFCLLYSLLYPSLLPYQERLCKARELLLLCSLQVP